MQELRLQIDHTKSELQKLDKDRNKIAEVCQRLDAAHDQLWDSNFFENSFL